MVCHTWPQYRFKMEKIKVNINDEVKLWNGKEGTVSEIDLSTYEVVITKDTSYRSKVHKMNIRFLNGEEVDAKDLVL